MKYENISLKKEDDIALITLERPLVHNVFNKKTILELNSIFENDITNDRTIRVAIITGSGEKAFCCGADIKEILNLNSVEAHSFSNIGQKTMNCIENCDIPVIAAINGLAIGGGCELAMACDILIASDTAKFATPEINIGIIPGWNGTTRLAQRIGIAKAKELILIGETINADEALSIGLINKVVPHKSVLKEAYKYAEKLKSKSSIILELAKKTINHGCNNENKKNKNNMESINFAFCYSTEDRKEGMLAFIGKRKAIFKGE